MNEVSIVISTYGRPYSIIERAIRSALCQTYANISVYVVNDNDDDSPYTNEIEYGVTRIKEQDHRITLLDYPGNRGACYARNYGAFNSAGKYVAFLDDDDVWHPEKIERQVGFAEGNNVIAVTCDAEYLFVDKAGNIYNRKTVIKTNLERICFNDILHENIIGGCSWPLICRSVFNDVGGFKEGFPSAQDYELWLRLAERGMIGRIPEVLLDYYIYPSPRISNSLSAKIKGYEYIIDQYKNKAENKSEYVSRKYHVLAKLLAHNGEKKKALVYAMKSFKEKPNIKSLSYIPYCLIVATYKSNLHKT